MFNVFFHIQKSTSINIAALFRCFIVRKCTKTQSNAFKAQEKRNNIEGTERGETSTRLFVNERERGDQSAQGENTSFIDFQYAVGE